MGRGDELRRGLLEREIHHDRRRKPGRQRDPGLPLVRRHEHSASRADVDDAPITRVLDEDVHRLGRQPLRQVSPGCAAIVRHEDVTARSIATLDNSEHFSGDAIQRILQKAVMRLPEKQRAVFTMKYFEELKYHEISAITGTSVGALKASYHIAVKKLESWITLDQTK